LLIYINIIVANAISDVFNVYSGPILINATLISFCEIAHPDGSACNADDPTRSKSFFINIIKMNN